MGVEINEKYILISGQLVPLPEHEVYSGGVGLPGTECLSTRDGVRAGEIEEVRAAFGGNDTMGALSIAVAKCRLCDYIITIGRNLQTGEYYIDEMKYWGN